MRSYIQCVCVVDDRHLYIYIWQKEDQSRLAHIFGTFFRNLSK